MYSTRERKVAVFPILIEQFRIPEGWERECFIGFEVLVYARHPRREPHLSELDDL